LDFDSQQGNVTFFYKNVPHKQQEEENWNKEKIGGDEKKEEKEEI
jgi:hypothetical protein